jgi:Protein of unknown function (DUF1552)
MSKLTLNRRAVLRGAGSVAIALPWLEIMGSERRAVAAATPAQRFLAVYTPGGTVLDKWRPAGSETSFTVGPILQPLAPMLNNVLVLDGLSMKSAVGEQSQGGIIAWLTGAPQMNAPPTGGLPYASGPSVDQVLARSISSTKKKNSLQVAVRWGTGKGHGLPSPTNIANFADNASYAPITPQLDPVTIWRDLFGNLTGDSAPRVAWDKSILDAVAHRYQALAPRLGASDKQKLEAHLDKIREMEQRLSTITGATCSAPTLVDTTGYNPLSGLNSSDTGSIRDPLTDAAIPKVGKLMMDMIVMAMACDLTAVGTLQWGDTEAKYTTPWLNLPETHYFYENGGGYHPPELELIYTWYSQQHAYLLGEMAKIDMGGHSLLDESVVFFGSEVSNPATHSKLDMPFLLAGGGGGLRGGRWLKYNAEPHNNLLVSILNLFGDTRTTFGDPTYCTGPLTNLT